MINWKPYYNRNRITTVMKNKNGFQLNTVFSKMLIIYSLLKMMINWKPYYNRNRITTVMKNKNCLLLIK